MRTRENIVADNVADFKNLVTRLGVSELSFNLHLLEIDSGKLWSRQTRDYLERCHAYRIDTSLIDTSAIFSLQKTYGEGVSTIGLCKICYSKMLDYVFVSSDPTLIYIAQNECIRCMPAVFQDRILFTENFTIKNLN